ncbi:hypothetical protein BTO30_02940 [Domibacillus antri]|uniref:DUF3102 domain-containing protein n=1 Tax=Domibacillus antri TaxID=1714264 RepID=A0A1Q8Q8N4_9BACI|nr:DUF3102 domain-containing protein [Domibacillus antri]OLN23709.1 hypothetical protein BTO30_02940 [Domibacillus antri]
MTEVQKGGATVSLSTDINVITAEINAYKQVAGEAIFEIGRRLKHVKENDLAHGQFTEWVEQSAGIPYRQANRFMKVVNELTDEKMTTSSDLGLNVLYEIATMSEESRDQPHVVNGVEKHVHEMTVRELREVKKALKEAEQAARQSPKTEYIEVTDEKTAAELELYREIYGELGGEGRTAPIDDETEFRAMSAMFSSEVRELVQRFSYLRNYSTIIRNTDDATLRQYETALETLKQFTNEVGRVVVRVDGETIIDMEAV